ncbi:suppressor of cytokine signaling 1a [Conger conger]|uniref:suppressor of cytokine signaling 1a n=1 Tax=Conger conger TaxID=82655 RepID=UPI002A598316|nr:suppressor of cytokine signaling 1a [Conger conger]XP_061080420.1 suppressor of cytokine signaling 1a [Conger conger]
MVAQGNVEGNASAAHREGSDRQPADPLPCRQGHPHPRALALPPPRPQNLEYPTHFRTFKNVEDLHLITATSTMLETSGFYWGPMAVEEAHSRLRGEPLGTFLVRDSQQKDVFFTLSYRSPSGPVSIRINFQASRFSLSGSKESFDSLFKLLEHYTSTPRKSLTRPYRKVRLRTLQELCRQRIVQTWGRERIHTVPVNHILKDFLLSFPCRL